jgi:hypothetical protein
VRLEALALAPERLGTDEGIVELRRLQYALHSASEDTVGLSPPPAAGVAHDELAAAVADARDATGELVAAIEDDGPDALDPRLYVWRGALFRIRLARLRLDRREQAPTLDAPVPASALRRATPTAASIALALTLVGTVVFLYGAAYGPWPLSVLGAVVVCSSLLVYRP